jgi:hypothetical protein
MIIGGLIRTSVAFLAGWLVRKGVVDESLHGQIVTQGTMYLTAGIMMLIATYGASAWQKVVAAIKLKLAFMLDPKADSQKELDELTAKHAKPTKPLSAVRFATEPGTTKVPR